jgi:hypothetical protein
MSNDDEWDKLKLTIIDMLQKNHVCDDKCKKIVL